MSKKVIITTTNSIEDGIINEYLGIINTNIVIGTNIFSDLGATITNIVGGTSTSYQNKLEKMQEKALEKLKYKLREIGGNAIIGTAFDFDEISGGGKSMFMLSVSGTAVKFQYKENFKKNIGQNSVSYKNVLLEIENKKMMVNLNKGGLISLSQWENIIENPNEAISKNVIDSFTNNYNKSVGANSDEGKDLLVNTLRYFSSLNETISKEILYDKLSENTIQTKLIIEKNKLFDAKKVIELIEKGQINISLEILSFDKPVYTNLDFKLMNDIVMLLEQKELKNEQQEHFERFKKKLEIIETLLNKD